MQGAPAIPWLDKSIFTSKGRPWKLHRGIGSGNNSALFTISFATENEQRACDAQNHPEFWTRSYAAEDEVKLSEE